MNSKDADMISRVAEIEHECFGSAWGEKTIEETLSYDYNYIILAYDEAASNTIVGYIIYNIISGESELLRIAVDKTYRGRGYGDYLIKKYLAHIKENALRSILEVRQANEAARALYEKNNYKQIAIRKNYYSNPVSDAIIYERKLP